MSIDVMKQALEALELHAKQYPYMQKGYTVDAIAALRAAIKEAESVEPVAWLDGDGIVTFGNMKYGFIDCRDRAIPESWKPLYLAPPATQQAKPLTTEQWRAIALEAGVDEDADDPALVEKLVRAVEAAHGIKEQP